MLGAAVGSFLNVVISRVPEELSVISPSSRCPVCERPIRRRDNIPIVSWLVLRGRCRTCRTRIPASYPLVELATAVVWAAAAAWGLENPYVVMSLVIATALIALTVIDLRIHRLPRVLVTPLYVVVVIGLGIDALVSGSTKTGDPSSALIGAAIGAALWALVIGGLWWFSGGSGMGFGDVTLAPVLGATLGWLSPLVAGFGLIAAFTAGAIIGGILMLTGRAQRRSRIPFGPFLAVGWLAAVTVGPVVVDAYLATFL